jgi:hypothetical protein
MSILKSKLGLIVLTFFVAGIFILLFSFKKRSAVREHQQSGIVSAQSDHSIPKTGTGSEAALMKKAQNSANDRGEQARSIRKKPANYGDSYDENGDLATKRLTPEPLNSDANNSTTGVNRGEGSAAVGDGAQDTDAIAIPSLRIHGRAQETKSSKDSREGSSIGNSGIKQTPQPKPKRFLPFGRLIKAELFMTLESTQDEMPLIGIIIEPLYNNGHLIIPAGTEVHGTARPDRVRNRIVSGNTWKMIFPREGPKPNGRQLTFDGIALDRDDRDGNGLTWGITDGSYGLSGRMLRSYKTQDELMIFAAETIKSASATMMDRQQTLVGATIEANAKNAALAGGQAMLEQISKQISDEIKKNGIYIQVPAGAQFYVYPRQVLDPDRADIPDSIAKVE